MKSVISHIPVGYFLVWIIFAVVAALFLVISGYQSFDYIYEVPGVVGIAAFETRWIYAWLHFGVFLPVFLLSFDKKVWFASRWKYLFPAILLVALPFLVWDHFFTAAGVWEFNEHYISGIRFGGLPWEEVMFFVTVPFACVFVYDCLNAYFPANRIILWEQAFTVLSCIALSVLILVFFSKIYTVTACVIALLTLVWVRRRGETSFLSNFYRAFLVVLIPFFLTDGILTGGFTNEPIVLYNADHFSGYRIVSIPMEDYIYGFALLLQVNYLYVLWRRS